MSALGRLLFLAVWISSWVIASGFWSTFFAIFFWPYSAYLVAEALLRHWGIVA